VAAVLILIFTGTFSFAIWIPTKKKDLPRIAELIDPKPGETFVEIGCGDGRVVHFLSKKFPTAKFVGIELSPFFFALAKLRKFFRPRKNLKIIYGNAANFNFKKVKIVFLFLMPTAIAKLEKKIANEAPRDAQIISYVFPFSSARKFRTFSAQKRNAIHIWEI
jgi:16S rRNA A1518/A1519 N6-dimethyltransferase RsmA/KsgA/DIM1 with predicted DNA glycosylase/AP lyase activity